MNDTLFDMENIDCMKCGRPLDAGVCAWCDVAPRIPDKPKARHHHPDIGGSKQGAYNVAPRAKSQKARILLAYASGAELNSWEAAEMAGISAASGYRMRCSELRDEGLIEEVKDEAGNTVLRDGPMGSPQMVCRITADGMKAVRPMKESSVRSSDSPIPVPADSAPHVHVWTWRDAVTSIEDCRECGASRSRADIEAHTCHPSGHYYDDTCGACREEQR
jgi:hypothetical protein